MVRQGDIIKVSLDPQSGHEQAGYRPAVVVSNNFFNGKTNMTLLCPITNTPRPFPLHIPLDNRTATTGTILCEHVRAVDLDSRPHRVIEQLPDDLLDTVIDTVCAQMRR